MKGDLKDALTALLSEVRAKFGEGYNIAHINAFGHVSYRSRLPRKLKKQLKMKGLWI